MEGDGHKYVVADLTVEDDLIHLVNSIDNLDVLVNNAGIDNTKPAMFIQQRDFETIINTNLRAPIFLTKGLYKSKKLSKGSSVVFTSSISHL